MMFCRSLKAEKERDQQEMEFQLKIMEMENQRRLQEREHEIRVFSLMMGSGSNMQKLQWFLTSSNLYQPLNSIKCI